MYSFFEDSVAFIVFKFPNLDWPYSIIMSCNNKLDSVEQKLWKHSIVWMQPTKVNKNALLRE